MDLWTRGGRGGVALRRRLRQPEPLEWRQGASPWPATRKRPTKGSRVRGTEGARGSTSDEELPGETQHDEGARDSPPIAGNNWPQSDEAVGGRGFSLCWHVGSAPTRLTVDVRSATGLRAPAGPGHRPIQAGDVAGLSPIRRAGADAHNESISGKRSPRCPGSH